MSSREVPRHIIQVKLYAFITYVIYVHVFGFI